MPKMLTIIIAVRVKVGPDKVIQNSNEGLRNELINLIDHVSELSSKIATMSTSVSHVIETEENLRKESEEIVKYMKEANSDTTKSQSALNLATPGSALNTDAEIKEHQEVFGTFVDAPSWDLKRSGIAFFTTFCGSKGNVRNIIPPVYENIDCFLITDNYYTKIEAEKAGYTVIIFDINLDEISSSDAAEQPLSDEYGAFNHKTWRSNMRCKLPRTLPHLFYKLDRYKFLFHLDTSAIQGSNITRILYEVERLNSTLQTSSQSTSTYSPKAMSFNLHPYSFPEKKTVQEELKDSLNQQRYSVDELRYSSYIKSRIEQGLSGAVVLHGGFVIRNMDHPMTTKIGSLWYSETLMVGIQDQISLSFVYEKYQEYILLTEFPIFPY